MVRRRLGRCAKGAVSLIPLPINYPFHLACLTVRKGDLDCHLAHKKPSSAAYCASNRKADISLCPVEHLFRGGASAASAQRLWQE